MGIDADELAKSGASAGVRLDSLSVRQLSAALRTLLQRIEIHSTFVRVSLRLQALSKFIAWDGMAIFGLDNLDLSSAQQLHVFDIPAAVKRERNTSSLPVAPRSADPGNPCPRLLRLMEDANEAQKLLFTHRDLSLSDLAYLLGRKPASFARLIRLNYLAPDIMTAIIDGTQPRTLTRKALAQCDLPNDWRLQRRLLGFPVVPDEDQSRLSPEQIRPHLLNAGPDLHCNSDFDVQNERSVRD